MSLSVFDIVIFVLFFVIVIAVSIYKSRKENTTEDYFLAGRSLSFWLVGFSLIASNISTEHFVGMAGSGFGSIGFAVASYEWLAATTLVFVAIILLPRFISTGIYTVPEYLEIRYNSLSRMIMAIFMMIMYVAVGLAAILYSGAIALSTIFDVDLTLAVWLIGIIAGLYTIYGGLKAVVWTDLFQAIALLLGGLLVLILGLNAVGGIDSFVAANKDKLHLILPADHPDIPWTALILGLWIPNIFYWGLNQFIVQRTLGASSVREGQKGIMLAAFIKLVIPFIIVIPGIIAYQLYGAQITNGDEAYPTLVREILPSGLRGIMFAALFGAILSSLDSMLNSASTIFTMDLFKKHINTNADQPQLIKIGRYSTFVFVIISCVIAPLLQDPNFKGVFNYIQKFQGFISPGIVVVFLFGIFVNRAPAISAVVGLLSNIIIYGLLLWILPQFSFLNHMSITFILITVIMGIITYFSPREVPFELPNNPIIKTDKDIKVVGYIIIVITILLYLLFW